jgi:hypothetical protein
MNQNHKFPLFFKEPVALMEGDKRSSYVTLPKSFKFASKTNSVPLAVTEFEMACRSYLIVFSSGETVAPVSIVGLRAEENLFLDEECAWLSNTYVPAYVRHCLYMAAHQVLGRVIIIYFKNAQHVIDELHKR